MERDLNNDEFEIFLKQKADQHKLYPSDKAWKGIYNSLHPGMKWFKIGGTFLILSTLFVVYQETSIFNTASSGVLSKNTNERISKSNSSTLQAVPAKKYNRTKADFKSNIAGIDPKENAVSKTEDNSTTTINGSPQNTEAENAVSPSGDLLNNTSDNISSSNKNRAHLTSAQLSGFPLRNINLLSVIGGINVSIPPNHSNSSKTDKENLAVIENSFSKTLSSAVIGNTFSNEKEVSVNKINWLQEMAAIRLTSKVKSKFNLQFNFSPTVSYRHLADNQNVSHSSIIGSPSVSRDLNINRYVDHNPAIGAELGSNILFSLTKNFTLKSGLQLNYSRYNIKAFKSPYEKASIALYNNGRASDTISSYTGIRNYSGYASDELQNQYLQVSVPIGAELKLIGNKRLQFSVAGTIQPTFLLFSDTYLLSTNYINYVKEPSLVRKWNVHSSFEAFLSYKTGGLRWQLGPQFRYQLMSSFKDSYPIKEYLLEYGVKIGVSKTIR